MVVHDCSIALPKYKVVTSAKASQLINAHPYDAPDSIWWRGEASPIAAGTRTGQNCRHEACCSNDAAVSDGQAEACH